MKLISFVKRVVIDVVAMPILAMYLVLLLGSKKVILWAFRKTEDVELKAKAITVLTDDIDPLVFETKEMIKLAAKDLVGL